MRTVFVLILLQIAAYSQTVSKVSTSSAKFLAIDYGARATGMGSAFVAIADDATGAYWNPAGLGFTTGIRFNSTYSPWLDYVNLHNLSVVLAKEKWGAIGISGTLYKLDDMEVTTINQPYGTGEYFDAASRALGITYANKIMEYISLGSTFKYVTEEIYRTRAEGYAFDFGFMGKIPILNLRLGISYSNYGMNLKTEDSDLSVIHDINPVDSNNVTIAGQLENDTYILPEIFRFGFAFDPFNNRFDLVKLNFAFDGVKKKSEDLLFYSGVELVMDEMYYFRWGLIDVFEEQGPIRLTLGAGIRVCIANIIAIKYDFSRCERLDLDTCDMHTFGAELLLN